MTLALALEWSRPLGFAALALPLAVLILQRALGRPPELATGTLSLWREVHAARPPRSARARGAPSPRLWILLAALALGAIALAGPREARPERPRAFRVVLDRSPSMYLPWRDAEQGAAVETRLERALASLAPMLEELVREEDVLTWVDAAPGGDVEHEGARPPDAWLVAPEPARPAPESWRFDQAGTVLVTDRAPEPRPRSAGYVAAGGAAVPGVIGRAGAAALEWDGVELRVEDEHALPPARARIEGRVSPELRDLLAAWAEERGLELAADGAQEAELVLSGPPSGERIETTAGRDGWTLSARASAAGVEREGDALLETWLGTHERALVAAGGGRVQLAFDELESLAGDLEAFALSWSRLFDAARRAPEGAVAFDERADAGGPALARPSAPASVGSDGPRPPYDAWLGLAAAALALGALAAPRARRRTRPALLADSAA